MIAPHIQMGLSLSAALHASPTVAHPTYNDIRSWVEASKPEWPEEALIIEGRRAIPARYAADLAWVLKESVLHQNLLLSNEQNMQLHDLVVAAQGNLKSILRINKTQTKLAYGLSRFFVEF
jgi:hypothetical protein